MTPEQFFVEQAKFNKWLFDLTSDEAKHITSMLNEYAEAKAKEFAEWLHEYWNAKHGGWSAKTGDINTVYSADALYKSFIQY